MNNISMKNKLIAFVLSLSMLISLVPSFSLTFTAETMAITNPFTVGTGGSQSFRIPAMVTLSDGTIVAAADMRWNTTYDGGGLDTLVATSRDGGLTWTHTVANYLGDNGNEYNSQSSSFIDSCLTVAPDGKTVYLLCALYPYGVALNGNGSQTLPSTEVGFNSDGYLKLRRDTDPENTYNYYLKDGKIYGSDGEVSGYSVDSYFNITYKNSEGVVELTSNLFYANSPFKVVRTGYLYLTSSSDGGEHWSAPTLLNLKNSSENVCLASPGNGITTSNGTIVFPVYSYFRDGSTDIQKLGFIYSVNGGLSWSRSSDFSGIWASESSVVEVGNGILRFFFRNKTSCLCYVDYNMSANTWGNVVNTGCATNSNTQLSAISYSKTNDGNQVILVSCPTGPNEAGSANNDGSMRTNGKIFVGVVAADGTMTWPRSVKVNPDITATAQLSGSVYTEVQGFFAYSAMTKRADGSIVLLYENNQFGWGASANNSTYFTIGAKVFTPEDLGLASPEQPDDSDNVYAVYEHLFTITTWREWEEYFSSLDEEMLNELRSLPEDQVSEIERLDEYFYKQKQEELAPPAVDFVEVAPLVLKTKVGDTEIIVDGVMPVNAVLSASAIDMTTFDKTNYDFENESNILAAYDIKVKSNENEWQPDEDTVKITIDAASLGLADGTHVVVHHENNGIVTKYNCVVENGLISFDVNSFSDFVLELSDDYGIEYVAFLAKFTKSPVRFYQGHLSDDSDPANYKDIVVTENDIIQIIIKYNYVDGSSRYVAYEYMLESDDPNFNQDLYDAIYGSASSNGKYFNVIDSESIVEYIPGEGDPDVEAEYNRLINITSWREWEERIYSLSEEMLELLRSLETEQIEELERLDNYFYKEKRNEFAPTAVDFTDVAPLISNIFANSPISYLSNTPAVKSFAADAPSVRTLAARVGNSSASFAPLKVKPNNGLNLTKTVTPNSDGTYTINLEAYTTGNVTPGEAIPSDIILVLDLSTSMNKEDFISSYKEVYSPSTWYEYYIKIGNTWQKVEYCDNWRCNSWTYGCYHGYNNNTYGTKVTPKTSATDTTSGRYQFYDGEEISRLEALKSAMTSFIDTIADQATEDRIALVGFHSSGTLIYGQSDASALVDATTYETQLLNAISALNNNSLRGATEHGRGMEKAKAVFDAQTTTDYSKRNKVVVMVTDGQPAPSGTDAWSVRTVRQAINAAYDLKKPVADGGHAATVYTISVMPGTDASNPTSDMDKYMTYMSSNYPNAQYTGTTIKDDKNTNGDSYYDPNNNGDPDDSETSAIIAEITPGAKVTTTGSYYLTAGNLAALDGIFGNIAAQTGGAAIDLDATTQIKDIVSPYFQLPAGASENSISITIMDATYSNGTLGWTTSTSTDPAPTAVVGDNRTVTVTGFDFTKNFVAETGRTEGNVSQSGNFHGRKLVISFKITPNSDFLGGNNVPTNGAASGVYRPGESTPVEAFELPVTNVPIKQINPVLVDQHIYITNNADIDTMISDTVNTNGDYKYEYKLGDEIYSVDGKNNGFVRIIYNVYDSETAETPIKQLTIPAEALSGSWNVTDTLVSGLDEDKTYYIDCTVDPITTVEGGYSSVTSTTKDPGTVYVYNPVLKFKDDVAYLGEVVPDINNNQVGNVVWVNESQGYAEHGSNIIYKDVVENNVTTKTDTSFDMHGAEPQLELTYSIVADATNNDVIVTANDIPVNVTVKREDNGTVLTDKVTFEHQDCDGSTPETMPVFSSTTVNNVTVNDYAEFVIHVNTVSLDVSKIVAGIKTEEKFEVTIKLSGNYIPATLSYTIQQTVEGATTYASYTVGVNKDNNTATILIADGQTYKFVNLPIGTYIVEEATSAKYVTTIGETVTNSATFTLSSTTQSGSVTFTNTINLTSLTIYKEASGTTYNVKDSFIFNVYEGTGNTLYATVVLQAGEYAVIPDLVVGSVYRVEEVTDWSWRYSSTQTKHPIDNKLDYDEAEGTENALNLYSFANTVVTPLYWLDNESKLENRWSASGITPGITQNYN